MRKMPVCCCCTGTFIQLPAESTQVLTEALVRAGETAASKNMVKSEAVKVFFVICTQGPHSILRTGLPLEAGISAELREIRKGGYPMQAKNGGWPGSQLLVARAE